MRILEFFACMYLYTKCVCARQQVQSGTHSAAPIAPSLTGEMGRLLDGSVAYFVVMDTRLVFPFAVSLYHAHHVTLPPPSMET